MTVTLTSLRLRSLWGIFPLSWMGLRISLQAKKSPGFLEMKNRGTGYLHFTASRWQSVADAKAFAHSGAHLESMKKSARISTEIRIYTYVGDTLPSWPEVHRLLQEKGKVFSYQSNSQKR